MAIEGVIEEALRLSEKERTEGVAHPLYSIDDAGPLDPCHEAAWTDAIDRRLQAVRDGSLALVDAADAVSKARAAVATRRQ